MYTCTSVTSVIWNPYLLKDINKLQKVQDRCLALWHEPIQMDSLEKRRNDSDMCETYNILNHKYKINPDSLFQRPTRELRGHQLKLHKVQVNTNVAKHFFFSSCCGLMEQPDCLSCACFAAFIYSVRHSPK